MIRLLKFLITGDWHLHHWKIIGQRTTTDGNGSRWQRLYCQCKVCGECKVFEHK